MEFPGLMELKQSGVMLLPPASEGSSLILFVSSHLGRVPTLAGGGGTYLGQGGGYLPWSGGTYLGWGYLPWLGGYLPWPGGMYPP